MEQLAEPSDAGEGAHVLAPAASPNSLQPTDRDDDSDGAHARYSARRLWVTAHPHSCPDHALQAAYDALLQGDAGEESDPTLGARRVVAGALRLARHPDTAVQSALKAVQLALQAQQIWTASAGRIPATARARRTLLDLQDRISTYEALYVAAADADGDDVAMLKTPRARHVRTFSAVPPSPRPPQGPTGRGDKEANGGIDPEEDAEGWDELDLPDESRADHQEEAHGPADSDLPPPPSLAAFLATPLPLTALSLASLAALPELCLLCSLHPHQLWPHRVQILEAIPLWCDPQAYTDLLPEVQVEVDAEVEAQERENGLVAGCERQRWAEAQPWRTSPDWSEQGSFAPRPPAAIATATATAGPARTATAVRAWYLDRIAAHVEAGFVDEALSLIQHGAARNVAGLEETGEDVSLLARLVYDRPEPPSDPSLEQEQTEWTLERWQSLTPREAVEAYTATSTPENLAQTIKRLVLPYLYVVQARAERRRTDTASSLPGTASTGGGEAEALTPTDYLYDYILSLPTRTATPPPTRPSGLDLFLAVVEASIPTLPRQQRLVSSDADLARLAIAALYGAGKAGASSEAAVIMGRVFECLPAFDSPDPSKDMESAQARVDLFALATQSRVSIPTPAAIFPALAGASTSDLSAHLDSLDLHLSQLETFLRYSSPPASSGLAWFLTSYRDRSAQAQWATRLARTASSGGGGRAGAEGAFESEDEWVGLMEFMGDATGVAQPSEGELEREEAVRRGLGRAFHLLNREEVLRIFFGGLLAAGRAYSLPLSFAFSPCALAHAKASATGFELARSMFDPSPSSSFSADTPAPPLEPPVVEDLVISASREFYDNAESGNQHSDEMKMALQWCVLVRDPAYLNRI